MNDEANKLINEELTLRKNCEFCNESSLELGERTDYGAAVIYRLGNSNEDGWFATLSPKTGGDKKKDFTIQLMPFAHLTHFSQISSYPELAKNYGVAFSKVSEAMVKVMAENKEIKATADSREFSISLATYGKCTTWKEKKEHLHIKIFPFMGDIGQPYTVDSSFERKKICQDPETGEKFVKMKPVRKNAIDKERFDKLSDFLISLLK